jgi:hypothetical protein
MLATKPVKANASINGQCAIRSGEPPQMLPARCY